MPARTTTFVSRPGFIVDHHAVRRNDGRQIDWASVGAFGVEGATPDRVIRAGTPMVQIDATGLIIPRPAGANVAGQTTVGLLASDAHENLGSGRTESLSGYGVFTGAVVYEQLLPVAIDATARTALEGLAGGGFRFETYSDNRAS